MSAGMPVPRQIVGHGWWLKDARKMSKSVGNVVRPDELVAAFGVDALRWHFLAAMSFGQDANFSDEDFLSVYNADLANGLGNTLSRAVKMSRDYFDGKTPPEKGTTKNSLNGAEHGGGRRRRAGRAAFEGYRLQDAAADDPRPRRRRSTATSPRTSRGSSAKVVPRRDLPTSVRTSSTTASRRCASRPCLLAPIAPRTATEILRRLGIEKRAEDVRDSDLAWGQPPARRAAPAGAAAVPAGGRERIFCFQGEDRG